MEPATEAARAPDTEVPDPPADRRTLIEEVVVVLALSLLASAVYAVIDLLSAPLKGGYVASVDQSTELAKQVAGFVFGLAPVYLVLHLARRSRGGVAEVGLAWNRPRSDVARGAVLFAIIGLGGLGVYLAAVKLGVNRFVYPVPPLHHWWTVPVLVMNSTQAGVLEEIILLGYLITRLRQLQFSPLAAVAASALLRSSYHLYQGWGGFAGNLAMGVLFGVLFIRWRRTWPFVFAHLLLDLGAGIGFILFQHHLPGFS